MNKRDFFIKACRDAMPDQPFGQAPENIITFRRKAWVISVFAVTNEAPDKWKEDPYPYRIVRTPTNVFFVDPTSRDLIMIEDSVPGEPLFHRLEEINLVVGELPNVYEPTKTTYGNVLFNCVSLIYPFHGKIPFMTGRLKSSSVENKILPRLVDDGESYQVRARHVKEDGEVDQRAQPIYVSEYIKFVDAMMYLTNFTQLFVPGSTRKTMTVSPDMAKLKKRLVEENKDRLHDPAVIAMIEAELIKLDREWIKGDRGEDYLIKAKSYNIVRKKLFGMYGAEPGIEQKIQVDPIISSLAEGWEPEKIPTMINVQRAGSFNRGAETELGGEAVKALLRASSNINIVDGDCGTKLGMETDIDGSNYNSLVGYAIVTHDTVGYRHVTADNAKELVGKTVMVRSPMFCKASHTDRCAICVGKNLAENRDGASVAIAAIGSVFLDIFMSAAHSKGLSVAKMDVQKAFT